jgi:hypothetical protein
MVSAVATLISVVEATRPSLFPLSPILKGGGLFILRKVYDDFAPVQKAKGVTAQAVYQAVDNPNDITVTHDFATVETAHAFVNSEELKSAMRMLALLARRQSGSPTRYSVTTLFSARTA